MFRKYLAAGIAAGGLMSITLPAMGQAIIDNGTIQMGVDTMGQLNVRGGDPSPVTGTTYVGLRYMPTGNESTSHGCLCEGWGVADASTGMTGSANNAYGTFGLSLSSFSSTASTATSVVTLTSGLQQLTVTHYFSPSATSSLYSVNVKIENTGTADVGDLRYRRVFDWDVEPTTFTEYSTVETGTASAVLFSSNDGFASANPLAGPSGTPGDFTDFGAYDHGALFDFGFGSLLSGESYSFDIFYGAAGTEAAALAALGVVGAEVYSFGQAANDPGGLGLPTASGDPTNTFIFAFAGVGGDVIVPPPTGGIPEPATWLMMIMGFGLVGMATRRRLALAR
ncbi:PEPxxWA-CTERM sorting domain-containing protein [Gimibacter soli]|uniref:PEPxxWA-CTERM sorting domain-containing protein n=1 Tax=Gimibacter soli TaxID=3024400 RepID=A0AAE9XSE5_9PROT|nr:PEPxxWA-CTERM sorting domain-containing protein [Gimibacter soli]WCL55354.1 PEPxxWA-CTERM sorting domain-containing protein [Gimibacter soli]